MKYSHISGTDIKIFKLAVGGWALVTPLWRPTGGHLTRPTWDSGSKRSQTNTSARSKYDHAEQQDMPIVDRVAELAAKHHVKMSQIALAWQWYRGVTAPIVGATKAQYLDDAAQAVDLELTADKVAYLEEPYTAHKIVGALDQNPVGMLLKDVK